MTGRGDAVPWWDSRSFVVLLVLAAFVPLLWPGLPPLVDLGGHMGRFKVAAEQDVSPYLSQWYHFGWLPIGNLGIDLLAIPLAKLVGVEAATKWTVIWIPPLTVAGMIAVAREVNGRLPPTAAFAVPLAYAQPFLFGFVNYALAAALALLAFALWMRLGKLERLRLRAALFLPIGIVIYFCHTFGWGLLGLLCFAAEYVRQQDKGRTGLAALAATIVQLVPLAAPLLFILMWRSEASGGGTGRWLEMPYKVEFMRRVFRDRWLAFDLASLGMLIWLLAFAAMEPRLSFHRTLRLAALVLCLAYILMPRLIFGSAFTDMRLAPMVVAIAILAIDVDRLKAARVARWLAVMACAFLVIRLAGNTASLAMAWDKQQRQLTAIERIDPGSKVAVLVWAECLGWPMRRTDNLGIFATLRKDAFTNVQFPVLGSSMLATHYPAAGTFQQSPSQLVRNEWCRREGPPVEEALARLPADAFDYLWMLDMRPVAAANLAGWTPVYRSDDSWLFRRSGVAPRPPATPRRASAPAR